MYKKIRETANTRLRYGWLYEDQVVSDFAMKGTDALSGYAEGATLIGLFGLVPFIERISETINNFLQYTANNGFTSGRSGDVSGGSCGSGGGCSGGGSCGGGCGGGCGGCGS